MASISPGSTSRTTLAPMVASAESSDATTQPRSSRPSTSGRMPCGSRAAYSVSSFIQTNEKAPFSCGSTSRARCSSEVSGWWASRAVTRPVSLVDSRSRAWMSSSPGSLGRSATSCASSWVLIRLPLWPSASEPSAVGRNVGCALCQVLAPVVE